MLIGTISVEKSELFSTLLKKANIRHNVLNAKNHAREADIIAEAGRVGAVTIATNMAGRGTDIKLGGERKYDLAIEEMLMEVEITDEERHILPEFKDLLDRMKLKEAEDMLSKFGGDVKKRASALIDTAYEWIEENKRVKELGGLFILGTERHEARRIDNQLRGRSGRQGDNGSSRFYISMDDDLMRLFGGERIQKMLSGFGMSDGEPIEHNIITNSIEKAQKKVESRNFEIRKHLLEYDDVLNKQRFFIYEKRDEILEDLDIIDRVSQTTQDMLSDLIDEFMNDLKKSGDFAYTELLKKLKAVFFNEPVEILKKYQNDPRSLHENLEKIFKEELYEKDKILGHEYLNLKLRELYLYLIDKSWQDHLENMEQLRESVMLRSYSQKNPLTEYKIEGSNMFDTLIQKIRESVVTQIFRIKIESVSVSPTNAGYSTEKADYTSFGSSGKSSAKQQKQINEPSNSSTVVTTEKVGRNEPCPCGSGKKYKQCCGK